MCPSLHGVPMPSHEPEKPRGIFLNIDLTDSVAFQSISGTAHVVFAAFMGKRQMKKHKHPRRSDTWEVLNNGQITFTFKEAKARRIPKENFRRAIGELVGVGFIDVIHPGIGGRGLHNQPTLYAISERWRKFGTSDFQAASMPMNPLTRVGAFKAHRAEQVSEGGVVHL